MQSLLVSGVKNLRNEEKIESFFQDCIICSHFVSQERLPAIQTTLDDGKSWGNYLQCFGRKSWTCQNSLGVSKKTPRRNSLPSKTCKPERKGTWSLHFYLHIILFELFSWLISLILLYKDGFCEDGYNWTEILHQESLSTSRGYSLVIQRIRLKIDI